MDTLVSPKGDRATVVTDAYNGLGVTPLKLKADIAALGDELGIKMEK